MKTDDEQFSFFDIDQDQLDHELVRQPRLYWQHAQKMAEAGAEHERAKARLEVVEAELDREVRRDPTSFGIEKVTESVLLPKIAPAES